MLTIFVKLGVKWNKELKLDFIIKTSTQTASFRTYSLFCSADLQSCLNGGELWLHEEGILLTVNVLNFQQPLQMHRGIL